MKNLENFGKKLLAVLSDLVTPFEVSLGKHFGGVAAPEKVAGLQRLTEEATVVKVAASAKQKAAPAAEAPAEAPKGRAPASVEELQAKVKAGFGDVEGESKEERKSRKDKAGVAKRKLVELEAEVPSEAPAEAPKAAAKAPAKKAAPAAASVAEPKKTLKKAAPPAAAPAKAPVKKAHAIDGIKVGDVVIITDPSDDSTLKLKITEIDKKLGVKGIPAADAAGEPSLEGDDFKTYEATETFIEVKADGSNLREPEDKEAD